MGDIDVDIFLETLKQLRMSSKVESNIEAKHWLEALEEEIKYMRGFLKVTEKKRNKHAEVMNLVRQIKEAVVEVENFIELFVVQAFKAKYSPQLLREYQHYLSLERKKIKTLMAEIKQIYAVFYKSEGDSSSSMGFLKIKNIEGTFYVRTHKGIGLVIRDSLGRPKGMRAVPIGRYLLGFREAAELGSDRVDANYILKGDAQATVGGLSSSGGSNTSKETNEKVVVGFKEEVETVLGKLHDCGEGGQLEIISIIGAAGGGKTTLAREVYEHPLTSHTFEIRAWVNVSQDYDKTMKRNLLIRILEVASQKNHGDYEKSSEDTLGEETHKCLKGKKYLIVMDDIWGIEAWNDIQRSLPKECNGSKVLFTSRLLVVPNSIHCVSHCLAPLTKSCSWELLQKKVFGKKCCPLELVGIGEHIAEKCEGLPLAIVAIAGILAMEEKTLDMWEEVSKHLSSIIAKNQNGCMEILELSYNHLPLHLKACFVYIGGFPEDYEILVRELIWLWIAEGFIQQSEGDKSLEDIAKDYLSSLIDRSLVMVARKKSFGGIKVCRIHDLLRELCLKKAEEDDFLVRIYGDDTFSPSAAAKHRRLFISSQIFCESFLRPFTRNLRSLLCLSFQNSSSVWFRKNLSFFVEDFKLLTLRVLSFPSAAFHGKIERMYHLRYLAFQVPDDTWDCLSPFTSCLLNLETLTFQSDSLFEKTIPLPRDIFKMVKLRHLYAKRGVFKYHFSRFFPWSKLDSLQTLHSICPCEKCLNFLVRTPNLKKLGFYGELISNDLVLMLPDLEFLKCLETLSFNNCRNWIEATSVPPVLKFPPTITRLTLKNTRLNWKELSILQTLPSLEVLKLSDGACRGQIWNTSELEGFSQLKYLRLQDLDIREWNASEDQFPRLEVLVVKQCFYLERIPIDFANLNELREIEVKWSSRSAEESAREIQEEQRNTRGDDDCINLLAIANTF